MGNNRALQGCHWLQIERHFWTIRGTKWVLAALPLEVQMLMQVARLADLGENSRTSEGSSGKRLGWPRSSLAEGFRARERGPPEITPEAPGMSKASQGNRWLSIKYLP